MAGIPVYSQPRRGGGWELVGGARTDLTGLSGPEARALFLVAGPSSVATPALKAALRKLVRPPGAAAALGGSGVDATVLAIEVAGFSDAIEVDDPDVRAELVRIGERLVSANR